MVNQDIDSLASAALTLSQSEGIMYSVTALESTGEISLMTLTVLP